MAICLAHESALRYWVRERIANPMLEAGHRSPIPRASLVGCMSSKVSPMQTRMRLGEPIDLLVANKTQGYDSPIIHFHQLNRRIKGCHAVKVARDLYVVTPELALLQTAASMTLPELVVLACELCAYFIDDDTSVYGTRECSPLTSRSRIASLLDNAPCARGTKALRRAFPFIVDGAASHREIQLALCLCMPRCEGGYGLPRPKLNQKLNLSNNALAMCGQFHAKPDLLWPDGGVAIEYDSNAAHTGSERIDKDARRRNALQHDGIRVIVVTSSQLESRESTDAVACDVAKGLGIRLRVRRQGFNLLQMELRKRLLSPKQPGTRSGTCIYW